MGELTGWEKGEGGDTSGAAVRLDQSCRPAVLVLQPLECYTKGEQPLLCPAVFPEDNPALCGACCEESPSFPAPQRAAVGAGEA